MKAELRSFRLFCRYTTMLIGLWYTMIGAVDISGACGRTGRRSGDIGVA